MTSYRNKKLNDAIIKFVRMKEEIASLGRQKTIEYGAAASNHAEMLVMSGQLKEAEEAFLEALQVNRVILAGNNPTMGTFLNSLAEVYRRQGKFEEALETIDESIQVMGKANVKSSVKLAQIIFAKGRILRQMNKLQEASKSFVASYQMMHALKQTENQFTLAILNAQRSVYTDLGQYNGAAILAEMGAKIADSIWGAESLGAASWLLKQGTDLRIIGDHEKAIEVLTRARANYENQEGYPKNHDYILALNNLAMAKFGIGQVDDAVALAETATRLAGELEGTDSFFYATRAQNYAIVLFGKKDHEKASKIFESIMPILEKRLGSKHLEFQKILNDQATNTLSNGQVELAIQQWNRLLSLQEKYVSPSHPLYLSTLQSLINANKQKGNEEAVKSLTAKLAAIQAAGKKGAGKATGDMESNTAQVNQLQVELRERIDQMIKLIEEKDADAIFRELIVPSEFAKMKNGSQFETIKQDFLDTKADPLAKILKSIDVSKATSATDGIVTFKPLDRKIEFQKIDGTWYIKN